ncbi:hypothetical protein E3Q22_00545 [Wallemia mellicola]|uniref:COP9 signalosome complex subunit 3 N-terminal helical repeats domain-containing protein n=1 Tax=Wallemia mellicola TaxID=1708541 RepID=A0A4T0TSX5_9BASI|nr:hypothetical protein E3Q24_01833 [Wallemia mellicola]TIB81872.1 hypothetical protein E3Q22_00545 [Wallemia mellicola]TIB86150.1 hypothetical protein E3Q21_01729 [Wallemia mellicola]TIB89270.1 hypothetical protein E3Q20_01722 [Wallemia mellicola]TIC02176.1 hypothetical protein E3Q17_01502 [Wallemia mellicola]
MTTSIKDIVNSFNKAQQEGNNNNKNTNTSDEPTTSSLTSQTASNNMPFLEFAKKFKSLAHNGLTEDDIAFLQTSLNMDLHRGIGMFITTIHNQHTLNWVKALSESSAKEPTGAGTTAATTSATTSASTSSSQPSQHDIQLRILNQYQQSLFYAFNTSIEHLHAFDEKTAELAEHILIFSEILKKEKTSLHPLKHLLTVFTNGNTNELTPLHKLFVKACITSNLPSYALPVIERGINELAISYSHLTANDNLHYFTGSATLFIMLERYEDALDVLEQFQIVTLPITTLAVNPMILRAYKQLILLQLIVNGQLSPLPKYTSGNLNKSLKKHASGYHSLVEIGAKATEQPNSFNNVEQTLNHTMEVLRKERASFTKDNLLDLALKAEDSVFAAQISAYSMIYTAMPISDLANVLGISSDHNDQLINKLGEYIHNGAVNAQLNLVENVIEFASKGEKGKSEEELMIDLENAIKGSLSLRSNMQELDRKLTLNPAYVKHHIQKSERKKKETKDEQHSDTPADEMDGMDMSDGE